MAYGLRILTKFLTGALSNVDYTFPPYDMPVYPFRSGIIDLSDYATTKTGYLYRYYRAPVKYAELRFEYISEQTMATLNLMVGSRIESNPVSIVYFGSLVGSNYTYAQMTSWGQLWGTCIMRYTELPEMVDIDLYNCTIELIQFATSQLV